MAHVHHVQQQFGLHDFFERGLEGFDQIVGEFADKTDGVRQQNVLVGGQTQAPRRRIEGGEQFILGQRGGPGEGVEQSRFAGIGVADDRGQRPEVALAARALGGALTADDLEFPGNAADAVLHPAAVGFQLRFAVTAHADAALLPGQVTPKTGEPRQQMLELGQLDLQLAFAGSGALGEDIEDERGPVEHLAFEDSFQVAALGRGKLIVENDGVNLMVAAESGELSRLAAANESGGHRGFQFLRAVAEDLRARGRGEFTEFFEGILEVPGGAVFEFQTDEKYSLGFFGRGFDQRFQFACAV